MPGAKDKTAPTTAKGRYQMFSDWLKAEKGVTIPAEHLQHAVRNYGAFQRSDVNREANSTTASTRQEERAQRQAATAERKAAAEAKAAERAARKSDREKAAIERLKGEAAKTTATTASAPAKTASKRGDNLKAPAKATKATKAPAKKASKPSLF